MESKPKEYIERAVVRGMLETALKTLEEIATGHRKGELVEPWEMREAAYYTMKEIQSDLKNLPHHTYDFSE